MKTTQKGFTLIELLIVIAIIGVLSSIVLVSLGNASNRAKAASVKSTMSSMVYQGILCRDGGGNVTGGNGNAAFCSAANASNATWPIPQPCSASTWTVTNGTTDNWGYSLTCTGFNACDGVANAVCYSTGCLFSGACR